MIQQKFFKNDEHFICFGWFLNAFRIDHSVRFNQVDFLLILSMFFNIGIDFLGYLQQFLAQLRPLYLLLIQILHSNYIT